MPKAYKNILFDLIKSLSKSEKRQFKLYTGRLNSNVDVKYLSQLIKIIEQLNQF